jgi:preprotein translocase subunit SecG
MYTFFLILLILDALVLSAAVLLQSGQGGGLAAEFGGVSSTDSFVGGRQAATLLTKTSWWGGGIFLALCFVLSVLSSRSSQPRSVFEQAQPTEQAPAPLAPLPLQNAAPSEAPANPPIGNQKAPARPGPSH